MADIILYHGTEVLPRGTWANDQMYTPKQIGIILSHPTMYVTLTKIDLLLMKQLYEYTGPTGTITATVYATFGPSYQPTGPALAQATINMTNIPNTPLTLDNPGVSWTDAFTISFPIPVTLSPATVYAIMVSVSAYDTFRFVGWYGVSGLGDYIKSGYGISSSYILYTPGTFPSAWFLNASANRIFYLYGSTSASPPAPPAAPTFPPTRPDGYAPDDFWIPGQWDGGTYTPPEWGPPTDGRYFATGGGRWGIQLVAVGHGKVYYEELT